MSTRDALLDAIAAADPDDPVPRLVFADFLDEEGEPDRAAFVRLCGRLAADPDDGPTAAAAGRMLADHRAAWFGGVYAAFGQPLPAVPPNRGWLARGFRRLTLRGGGLLDEDCNRPGLGGRYGWLPNGQAGKYDEPPLPVGALALAFGLLAEMEFRPAAAPDPAALGPAIAGHPVRSLKVALPDPPAWEALTGPHLRRVARLEIDPTRRLGPLDRLLADPHLTGLAELELQDGADFNDPAAPRHWTPDHIAALASSPLAGRLTSLELPPWDGFLEPLAGWPAGGPLDKLQVFGSVPRPRPPVGGRLAALPLAARVRELNLGMSDMGDADLEALVAGRWPRLTRLALWMNDLTARAAAALGRSPGLPALTNLDLSHNPIADARLLVPLAFRLTRLNLSDTRLTDAGATALLAAADGPLERLDVASNPLSARCRRRLTAAFGDRVRVDHRTYPPGWVGP